MLSVVIEFRVSVFELVTILKSLLNICPILLEVSPIKFLKFKFTFKSLPLVPSLPEVVENETYCASPSLLPIQPWNLLESSFSGLNDNIPGSGIVDGPINGTGNPYCGLFLITSDCDLLLTHPGL